MLNKPTFEVINYWDNHGTYIVRVKLDKVSPDLKSVFYETLKTYKEDIKNKKCLNRTEIYCATEDEVIAYVEVIKHIFKIAEERLKTVDAERMALYKKVNEW